MKKNRSKSIGSGYERDCARLLSEWFTGNKNDLVVWRTSGSGSVGTIRKKKGLEGSRLESDFQCIDKQEIYGKFFDTFFLDSKSLTGINLFLTNEKNQKSNKLLNEWKKVYSDSGNKLAMMLVKVRDDKSMPDFIMFQEDIILNCNHCIYLLFKDVNINAFIVTQDEFFKYNKWNTFLEKNKNVN